MNPEIEALRNAMKAAQVSGRGNYIGNGIHLLQLDRAFCKRTQIQGTWKETWICEFKVIKSTNPDHEPGQTRSHVENPANAGWMDRFKGALAALAGVDPNGKISNEDQETISDMFAALRYDEFRVAKGFPENFLKGQKVICEGSPGKSRGGTDVTNKKYTPYVEPAGAP